MPSLCSVHHLYAPVPSQIWREMRRWYRRAQRAIEANPERAAMTLVFGLLALLFLRAAHRNGFVGACTRRCRRGGAKGV